MDVILCQAVPKLGKSGDVVKVKPGYGRNYLLPNKLAFLATADNIKRVEQQRAKEAALSAQEKKAAEDLAQRLSKASCTITVEVNDLERMYGSVTDADIAKVLQEEGFDIDKKAIVLDKPMDELGIYEVQVKVHPEVNAQVRVWVAKK